jgi:outer membrane protein TolC
MKRISLSVALLGLGVVTGVLVSSGLAEPDAVVREPGSEKLTALRKERRDALRGAVDVAMALYRNARIEQGPVLRITNTLLNAELDLAPDRAARIALREQTIKQLRSIEEIAVTRKESARGTQFDILEVQADRLQAEINLLLEISDGK